MSLPPHRDYDCAIDLPPGAPLPKGWLYSLSNAEDHAMEEYINSSLQAGIIRPSSSPVGAGFFFVEKKDKTLRPCIDYTGLNDITIKNRYSLPLMTSAFDQLQGARVFTKLDLRNAYHLVRIREGDGWKTVFNTPIGHYEYLVMPFGLTNAPAVFQSLISDILRDMINHSVYVYLDDILSFSPDLVTHTQVVREVLLRLLKNQLFVKAEKCEFHSPSVAFLGYIISEGQIEMDQSKVRLIQDWPIPSSRKEVQRFLGFANFYMKFRRNFGSIAAPIHALTSSKVSFSWTPSADAAFQRRYSPCLIARASSLWRWMLQTQGLEPFFRSDRVKTTKYTHVLSSPEKSLVQKGTMRWVTGNCWRENSTGRMEALSGRGGASIYGMDRS